MGPILKVRLFATIVAMVWAAASRVWAAWGKGRSRAKSGRREPNRILSFFSGGWVADLGTRVGDAEEILEITLVQGRERRAILEAQFMANSWPRCG